MIRKSVISILLCLLISASLDGQIDYSWQLYYNTDRVLYHQNDAFLYGAGLIFSKKRIKIEGCFAGYAGYVNIKDSPMVLRLNTELAFGKVKGVLGLQQGVREDFDYTTLSFGIHVPIFKDVF